jgi:hypothetical protein
MYHCNGTCKARLESSEHYYQTNKIDISSRHYDTVASQAYNVS